MDNDVNKTRDDTFIWAVIFDQTAGGFYNISLVDDKKLNLQIVCKEFEMRNPKYLVAQAGIGLETRPIEVRALPYLYYYN